MKVLEKIESPEFSGWAYQLFHQKKTRKINLVL